MSQFKTASLLAIGTAAKHRLETGCINEIDARLRQLVRLGDDPDFQKLKPKEQKRRFLQELVKLRQDFGADAASWAALKLSPGSRDNQIDIRAFFHNPAFNPDDVKLELVLERKKTAHEGTAAETYYPAKANSPDAQGFVFVKKFKIPRRVFHEAQNLLNQL